MVKKRAQQVLNLLLPQKCYVGLLQCQRHETLLFLAYLKICKTLANGQRHDQEKAIQHLSEDRERDGESLIS